MNNFTKNLRKYINYAFDTQSFTPEFESDGISNQALSVSQSIRGDNRSPAIMIHGIMKRSGTVYVGELLSLHPDIHSYPNKIWEVPFLPLTGDIQNLQQEFFLAYEQNIGKIGEDDFLPIFGAAFVNYLYALTPEGRRLLVKMPGVQYLHHFYSVFPSENLLVLTRDGRDLVASTIKTWPQIRFSDACRRWNRSAQLVMTCHARFSKKDGYWLAQYENAVKEPERFVEEACQRFHLDFSQYPLEKIQSLRVIGSSTTRAQGKTWIQKPKDFQPIGRWQHWSAWKKWTFKRIAGQSLIELGYCTDLDW